jgi:hypothetical protein
LQLYEIAFLRHDKVVMEEEAAALMGQPGYEDAMFITQSDTAAYTGEFGRARELTHRAEESARRADEKQTAALYTAKAAVREALAGNTALAKQQARSALAISHGRDVESQSALALARAGDSDFATRLTNDLKKRFPQDTIVQFMYLPTIYASLAIRSGNSKRSLEVLAAVTPYELGPLALYPTYVRGEAYLAEGQGQSAAAEFQELLDHPGIATNGLHGALAHLGLGRAWVLEGETVYERADYKVFLSLWKNADTDITIL